MTLRSLLDPGTLGGGITYGVVFFLAGVLLGRLVEIFARRGRRHMQDVTAVNFVAQLARVMVFLLVFILYAHLVPALRSMGSALLAGVSVGSIVIGMAAQSTLSNLIAGFSLLLYRPFHVGDRVQLSTPKGVVTATVQSLSLGYTLLLDSEGETVIVPNSVMASGVIIVLPAAGASDAAKPSA